MNLEILNTKHYFIYILFLSFFLFYVIFILQLLFYFCDSTFLNYCSLFLLSRDAVLLVIAQVLSRAYWLWWCLSHPLTHKILFLHLVTFSWFCDFSYILATFFLKIFRNNMLSFDLYRVQATMRQGKTYPTNRNEGGRYKHKESHENSEPSTLHPSLRFLPPIDLASYQSRQSHCQAPHA